MKRCVVCGRKFKGPGDRGPVCRRRSAKAALLSGARIVNDPDITPPPALKAFYMSNPRATATDRRTWLVRPERGPGSWLVRIFPDDEGRTAKCDCKAGQEGKRCEHVDLVAPIDARKFNTENKQND